MPIEIVVPQIGEAVAELTLMNWLKAEGDVVRKGDVLFEVDSDKAIVEVEAYVDGTLLAIHSPAGSAVMPQQVVALLQPADEPSAAQPKPAPEPERVSAPKVSPVAQRLAADLDVDLATVTGSGPGGRITADDVRIRANHNAPDPAARINASPKAKRLAREQGIDLDTLRGSGINGMVRVRDVEAVQPALPAAASSLTKLRQTIAARTIQSKQTIPHFYLMADVHMSAVNHLREYCRSRWEQRPPTYTDMLVRACALALRDHPHMNQHFTDAGLVAHDSVSIGVAVHTDAGLVAPVIPNADSLSLRGLSAAMRDMTDRARAGRLKPSDMGSKSMVVSNLGMYRVDAFVAIIDMPDPMILAVGRVTDRAVVVSGQVGVQPVCTLTLSADHRALDGVPAAQFLEAVVAHLENPFALLGDS